MPSLQDIFSQGENWLSGGTGFQQWPQSVMAPPEPWGHYAESILRGRYNPERAIMGWFGDPIRKGAVDMLGPTVGNPVATGLTAALPSLFSGGEAGIPEELPEAGIIEKTGVLKLGEAELPGQHKTRLYHAPTPWEDSTLHPILDANGKVVGRLFLDLDPDKGKIHVRMIEGELQGSKGGKYSSGFDRTPLLSIARQVREKYPWVKKVTGTRITGAHTGVNVYDPEKFGPKSDPKIGTGGVFEHEPDVAPTPEPEWRQQERQREQQLTRGGKMSPEERDRMIRAYNRPEPPAGTRGGEGRGEPTPVPTPAARPFSQPRAAATPARSFDEQMREFDERMRQSDERNKQTLRDVIGSAGAHMERLMERERQLGRTPQEEPIPPPSKDLNDMTFDELLQHAQLINDRNRLLLNRWGR